MKSIVEKLQNTIKTEVNEGSRLELEIKELDSLFEVLDKFSISKKEGYVLPHVDTIGKKLYKSLNSI